MSTATAFDSKGHAPRSRFGIAVRFGGATTAIVAATLLVAVGLAAGFLERLTIERAEEQARSAEALVREVLAVTHRLTSDDVEAKLRFLESAGREAGMPSAGDPVEVGKERVPDLLFGEAPQANHFALVDRASAILGGVATLFSRRGDDFVRVSTTVPGSVGGRAVGTLLDPKGKAIAAIREGKPFRGVVDILGAPYLTGYDPMRDDKGRVIGVWFAGYPLSGLARLKESVGHTRILESGFVALLDQRGHLLFGPSHLPGAEVAALCSASDGGAASEWSIRRSTDEQWGYQVVAAYPRAEARGALHGATVAILLIGIALALVLVATQWLLLSRMVLEPVRAVVRTMADADLNTLFRSARADEFGDLMRACDRQVLMVREALGRVVDTGAALVSASDKLNAVGANLRRDSEAMASQTEAVSHNAEAVSRAVGSVASGSEQMSSSIREISANAHEASRVAGEAVEAAATASSTVEELGRSSAEIGDVIKLITSVAEQTNLLALNATIEAARAGEAGRGFAVVANEVKELAKETARATSDIARRIESIQAGTPRAIAAIEHIGAIIARVNDIQISVAGAVEEQTATSNELSRSFSELASGSTEIARSIAGVTQAAGRTASEVQHTERAADELRRLSREMQEIVAAFHLEGAAAR